MSFLSWSWLLWMWGLVGLYWLVPRSIRSWFLVAASLAFLVSADTLSAALLIAAWAVTAVGSAAPSMRWPVFAVLGGILVASLASFKVGSAMNSQTFFENVAIPLGMSYYVFRCLHVLIDRFKGSIPEARPADLAQYLFFMPTFVVGPIHRFDTFIRDRDRQRLDYKMLLLGAERILIGYFKIAFLSNVVIQTGLGAFIASLGPDHVWSVAYLTMVQDGLNIYLQFSGHCDIAIGFAAMLGHRVLENFNWPYLKQNISDFWKSWHISLSRWCREYLYGIVVAKTRSPALGALATMVLIGLWHEISFRYLTWAIWHVIGIIIWQRWRDFQGLSREEVASTGPVMRLVNVTVTVHFVWLSFVILTTPVLSDAPKRISTILTGGLL